MKYGLRFNPGNAVAKSFQRKVQRRLRTQRNQGDHPCRQLSLSKAGVWAGLRVLGWIPERVFFALETTALGLSGAKQFDIEREVVDRLCYFSGK